MKEIKGALHGKGRKIAIVVSRFNESISANLLKGSVDCLVRHGVAEADIDIYWAPGAFEIPTVLVNIMKKKKDYNSFIALGAVIRGETPHFDYVAAEVSKGVASVSMNTGIPVSFGVLTADTVEQAKDRAGAKSGNKGWDAALSALEMMDLIDKI